MRATFSWLLGAILLLAIPGCDKGEDHILEGRKAVKAGNFEKGIEHFDNALKANPSSYDAMWGKADAYRRDNNLVKQAEVLEQISANKDMIEKFAAVVTPALETNYRKQAGSMEDSDPKKETLLRQAIKLNKASEAHITLATLLTKRGDDALKAQKWGDAATAYKSALELRIARKEKAKLKGKIEVAEFKQFVDGFITQRFDPMKAELVQAGNYDEKTRSFFVEVQADLTELEGKPGDEGYEANAERMGLVAVTDALNNLTWKVAGKPRPEGATVAYSGAVVEIVEKGLQPPTQPKKPGTYKFRVSVPQDALFEQVQKIDVGDFRKPGDAPAAPESGAAPASDGDVIDDPEAPGSDAPGSAAPGSEAAPGTEAAPASAPGSEAAPASAAPATN